MRVRAVVAYDGSKFLGFQKQTTTSQTITAHIERVLKSLNINSAIIGSGRTDAGVHATGQIIHFDLPHFWHDLKKLKQTINASLRHIRIKHISVASNDFHARFHAKKRLYRYVFKTSTPSLFEQGFIAHQLLEDPLKLSESLSLFTGTHDFSLFMKSGSTTKNNIREIYKAYHIQRKDYHYIYFEANGFLRAQVRMMIDFAIKVANSQLCATQLSQQLSSNQVHSRNLVPPSGLYLAKVSY